MTTATAAELDEALDFEPSLACEAGDHAEVCPGDEPARWIVRVAHAGGGRTCAPFTALLCDPCVRDYQRFIAGLARLTPLGCLECMTVIRNVADLFTVIGEITPK